MSFLRDRDKEKTVLQALLALRWLKSRRLLSGMDVITACLTDHAEAKISLRVRPGSEKVHRMNRKYHYKSLRALIQKFQKYVTLRTAIFRPPPLLKKQ